MVLSVYFLSNLLLTLLQFSDQRGTCNFDNGSGRVVGYFTTWSSRPFTWIQAQLLTHVNIAFATMDAAGSLSFNDGGQTVLQVRQVANGYPNLKVMVSVGGGTNSQYFSNITANPDLTNTFIANILNIIDNYSLDGVDIDWENPTTPDDKSNYVLLMQKIRSALDQHQIGQNRNSRYLLSFAGAPGQWALDPGYDLPGLLNYVDFVNVMTYDYYGTWESTTAPPSPLYGAGAQNPTLNVDWTLNYYTCKTNQSSKLNIGVPFYAYYWNNASAISGSDPMYRISNPLSGGSISWRDIPSSWNLSTATFHDVDKVPYIYNPDTQQYLGFENGLSIYYKGQYASQKNMGGLMIWSIDEDDDQYSLLQAVAQGASGLQNSNTVNYQC